tara:strand:- start:894 stop:1697 length:804 start_codon:yes stop_codon:yes gene_type:complete
MNTHPAYPTRVFTNDYDNDCPYFEHESVANNEGIWADSSNITFSELAKREVWKNNKLVSLINANIKFLNGKPITPIKTGIKGRGLLGKFGPNHAADPIVTRVNPVTQHIEFIAAKRVDTNQYCIPGGMVDPGESVSLTLKREFKEEVASKCDEVIINEVFKNGNLLYSGPTYNDPRTTDNAWIETYVMHYHISNTLAKKLHLSPQLSENSKVKWVSCSRNNLYGDHAKYVKMAEFNVIINYIKYYLYNICIVIFVIFIIDVIYVYCN